MPFSDSGFFAVSDRHALRIRRCVLIQAVTRMDSCVLSRMATCKSMLLNRKLLSGGLRAHNVLQDSCSESVLCVLGFAPVRHGGSTLTARSFRRRAPKECIQFGERKKFLVDVIHCPVFHGRELFRVRNRRYVLNDKDHANCVTISDDDTVDERKVLERFFTEDSETGSEDGELENEEPSRRTLLRHVVTMVRWDQHLLEKREEVEDGNRVAWWRKLDISSYISPHTRGIILLNLLTFLYGSNVAVIKIAGGEMDPTLFSFGRFAIASLVFAPFLRTAISNRKLVNVSAELGLWASIGYLTQSIAVITSEAARVSFISTFTVIVVPLLAGLSGAKVTNITWGAAFTALVGVAFLESGGTPFAIGDVWSFVSAIMFGIHMLRTEQQSTDFLPEDTLSIISLQMVVITFCSGMWSLASHLSSGDLSNIHAINWPLLMREAAVLPWPAMLYTGFLTTAFCLWCELASLRDVKATEAAVVYTMEPLWGAAFAWILMGERWGNNGWVGAAFILGGCLTMQLFGGPESPAKEETSPLRDFTYERTNVEDRETVELDEEVPGLTTSRRR